jgi:hypothetical protein
MNKIEKIYRMRRNVLVVAFICSVLLFCVFCLPGLLSGGGFGHVVKRLSIPVFKISGILATLLLLILLIRYFLFRASTLKDPSLRRAVDDERVRQNLLKAYRTAFFIMVGIHLAYFFLETHFYDLGLPHVGWVSSTTGLMTFFGTALFYTREVKNEQPR